MATTETDAQTETTETAPLPFAALTAAELAAARANSDTGEEGA